MATAAQQRMDAMEAQMSAIANMLGKLVETPTDDAETPAKPKTGKERVAETTARADGVKRNLDAETFVVDDNGVEVIASSAKTLFRQGSRAKMVRGGKTAVGSLSRSEIAFVRDHADEILSAMDAVDKRAKVGKFLPKTDTATAA